MSTIPYRFEPDATAAGVREEFDALEAGAETGKEVTLAGRLMLHRPGGKMDFGVLQDASGRMQVWAGTDWTDNYAEFSKLSLGDWIGVTGEVVKTRRGELSVKVARWTLLAETKRGFPDKWHGVTDVDTRYRQRYVDFWVTEDARRTLLARSQVVSFFRRYLADQGFIEVETPLLHAIPGGATARPFVTHHNALDTDFYLRIALELHLKRLVVGGFERVFEIGRVFRNEGIDRTHQPEFTMLELYQAYADYTDMASLTESLVAGAALEVCGTTKLTYQGRELDLTPPWRRATMLDLIEEHAGIRLDVRMPRDELVAIATEHGVEKIDASWGSGKLILEIYEKTTEPNLWGPVFVLDYPQEVSPLARSHREVPGLVERFEPILAGREIGNAFSELTDAADQRTRFEDQARVRAAGDDEAMQVDDDYVRALEYGLPPTGGLGIGIDRVVMLLTDSANIRDVMAFPLLRPEAN
jgi:lysyl-tRNA synthetase class 2